MFCLSTKGFLGIYKWDFFLNLLLIPLYLSLTVRVIERFKLNSGMIATHPDPIATILETRYDLAGRKTSTINYARALTDLDNIENLTLLDMEKVSEEHQSADDRIDYWLYDAGDQERFHFDPRGGVHEQRYDSKGRNVTRYHYATRATNVTELLALPLDELAQKLTASPEDRITQRFFNVFDKPEFNVGPDGSVQQFQYDNN